MPRWLSPQWILVYQYSCRKMLHHLFTKFGGRKRLRQIEVVRTSEDLFCSYSDRNFTVDSLSVWFIRVFAWFGTRTCRFFVLRAIVIYVRVALGYSSKVFTILFKAEIRSESERSILGHWNESVPVYATAEFQLKAESYLQWKIWQTYCTPQKRAWLVAQGRRWT